MKRHPLLHRLLQIAPLVGIPGIFGALTALPAAAAETAAPARSHNPIAIGMFLLFVASTLFITRWAAKKNNSVSDHYAAGGKITAFQNGWAIAGDYMSAASLLGISAVVFTSGYDGLIYSIGFLASWPVILFLIAEPLRNLGRYTLADVVSYRLQQRPIRAFAASSSIVIVLLYLVSQMVGAGKLVELLFGFNYTGWTVRPETRRLAQKPSSYLRRFNYDTVSHSGPVLDFLIQNIGIDRLVLGSDYCFDMGYEQPVRFLDRLTLPPEQKNQILGGNAAQLLKI